MYDYKKEKIGKHKKTAKSKRTNKKGMSYD